MGVHFNKACLRMGKELIIKLPLHLIINQGKLPELLLKHAQACSVLSQLAEQLHQLNGVHGEDQDQ